MDGYDQMIDFPCGRMTDFFDLDYLYEPNRIRKKARQLIDEDPEQLNQLLAKEITEIRSNTRELAKLRGFLLNNSLVVEDEETSLIIFLCCKTECLIQPMPINLLCKAHFSVEQQSRSTDPEDVFQDDDVSRPAQLSQYDRGAPMEIDSQADSQLTVGSGHSANIVVVSQDFDEINTQNMKEFLQNLPF